MTKGELVDVPGTEWKAEDSLILTQLHPQMRRIRKGAGDFLGEASGNGEIFLLPRSHRNPWWPEFPPDSLFVNG